MVGMESEPARPATRGTPPGQTIAEAILAVAAGRPSISPEDVAKSLAPEAWRPLLGAVRRHAAALAAAGRIDILRKGKPIDPAEMRGVIRLRLRAEDA